MKMTDAIERLVDERLRRDYILVSVSPDAGNIYDGANIKASWCPKLDVYFGCARQHIITTLMCFARVGICGDIVREHVLGRIWYVAIPVHQYEFCSKRGALAGGMPAVIYSTLVCQMKDIVRQKSFTFISAGAKHEFYIDAVVVVDGRRETCIIMSAIGRPRIGKHIYVQVANVVCGGWYINYW